MSNFDRALSDAELISATFKAEAEGTMAELRSVEQAVLAKLAEQEPLGYSDKTGRHYFNDLDLAKRLMPDAEFFPLYAHPAPALEPDYYFYKGKLHCNDGGSHLNHGAKEHGRPLNAHPIPETKEHHRTAKNHIPDIGQTIPEGWQLVPIDPTMEMYDAWLDGKDNKRHYWNDVYKAMLAAAPKYKGDRNE